MKHMTLLTISLAALATTANVASAQDTQPRPQPAMIRDGQTATIIADQDAALEDARKAMDEARAASEEAVKVVSQITVPGDRYAVYLNSIMGHPNAANRTLVIPKDTYDAKDVAEMEEDMSVMARILDKAVSSDADHAAHAMGIMVTPRHSGPAGGPQNLLIEGYGALFFLNVNFPLLPPPVKESETEPKEQTSSEWEEARREITQPQEPYGGAFSTGYAANRAARIRTAPLEYEADKVDDLKRELTAALKNVAHIRNLKSDETLIVVVTGTRATIDSMVPATVSRNRGDPVSTLGDLPQLGRLFASNSSPTGLAGRPSTLIFRVRKADAESFQKGNLSFNEFRSKVSMILY